ncbi:unnamed protein product, partial [Phaeothamnion confervicola]
MTKLVMVLRLQRLAYDVLRLHLAFLSRENVAVLLGALRESCRHAAAFNADLVLRARLYSYGFMRPTRASAASSPGGGFLATPYLLPHLLEQQAEAHHFLLSTLFVLSGVGWDMDNFLPSRWPAAVAAALGGGGGGGSNTAGAGGCSTAGSSAGGGGSHDGAAGG